MPIKPENKDKYPANWKEIRERIKNRASNSCEWCRVKNYAVGYRDDKGYFHEINLPQLSHKKARKICDIKNKTEYYDIKWIVIVCTVAHLDHNPENNNDNNLAFLCQRCHNRYDREHRNQTRIRSKKQL
jgi:hypothetical protein